MNRNSCCSSERHGGFGRTDRASAPLAGLPPRTRLNARCPRDTKNFPPGRFPGGAVIPYARGHRRVTRASPPDAASGVRSGPLGSMASIGDGIVRAPTPS